MTFHSDDREQSFGNWHGEQPAESKNRRTARCSLCGKSFDVDQSKTMPFCSPRCRQIDLGNWLNEGYGLPIESGEYDGIEDED